ncbi:peptidoglycan/LPS O-acetylase OafA/YrhL [Arthrobacter sp. 2762]
MAKSKPLGWWRSGKLPSRLLWLGAFSGAAGALAFNLNYMIGHVNAATLMWGMANLFIFEIPGGILLGLVVALLVLMARILVPKKASRMLQAAVTGAVALLCGGLIVSSVLHDVPVPGGAGVIGWIAGILVGIAFAVVSYRHPAGAQEPLASPATVEDSRPQ